MADIKIWAISLCVAAVAGGIMNLLIPNTSLEKIMKLVVAAFFLSCVISPVIMRFPEIRLTLTQDVKARVNEVQENLVSAVDGQVSAAVTERVKKLLKDIRVEAENISVRYNTADNTSISISQIDVVFKNKYASRKAEIKEYLSSKTGNQVNVYFS
ncbi:stage III sporulation protein AF [Acetanaerobacterium elongatum]|uniref:Stage III sporulation protein AF (Spore_III_AF) n=1 Tax=Acetanaerobacterium elongatum TaxID=258515 RepID=A0A1H0AR23_9FIRM|nr:stage III sporulation protein AF [Acetanaerobacterium elongatum]SDN35937.1 Stage III sporulation protein AF (Spore_III_AF) [Acetanaerobacterium elongatum]